MYTVAMPYFVSLKHPGGDLELVKESSAGDGPSNQTIPGACFKRYLPVSNKVGCFKALYIQYRG